MTWGEFHDLVDRIEECPLPAFGKMVAQIVASLQADPPPGLELQVDWEVFLASAATLRHDRAEVPA